MNKNKKSSINIINDRDIITECKINNLSENNIITSLPNPVKLKLDPSIKQKITDTINNYNKQIDFKVDNIYSKTVGVPHIILVIKNFIDKNRCKIS